MLKSPSAKPNIWRRKTQPDATQRQKFLRKVWKSFSELMSRYVVPFISATSVGHVISMCVRTAVALMRKSKKKAICVNFMKLLSSAVMWIALPTPKSRSDEKSTLPVFRKLQWGCSYFDEDPAPRLSCPVAPLFINFWRVLDLRARFPHHQSSALNQTKWN